MSIRILSGVLLTGLLSLSLIGVSHGQEEPAAEQARTREQVVAELGANAEQLKGLIDEERAFRDEIRKVQQTAMATNAAPGGVDEQAQALMKRVTDLQEQLREARAALQQYMTSRTLDEGAKEQIEKLQAKSAEFMEKRRALLGVRQSLTDELRAMDGAAGVGGPAGGPGAGGAGMPPPNP